MAKFKVLSNIDHDGVRYEPGGTIDLEHEHQVEFLRGVSAIDDLSAEDLAAIEKAAAEKAAADKAAKKARN